MTRSRSAATKCRSDSEGNPLKKSHALLAERKKLKKNGWQISFAEAEFLFGGDFFDGMQKEGSSTVCATLELELAKNRRRN